MNNIVFEPYIGPTYETSKCRLLLVGESHYDEPSAAPSESTRTVVEKWQSGEWNSRYLTTAARIICNKEADQIERKSALDGVAFYNFVQTMMVKGEAPTSSQARASLDAFLEVLRLHSPTHIIMGSYVAWDHSAADHSKEGTLSLDGMTFKARLYSTPKGEAVAIPLPHFSRASAPEWQKAVMEFLQLGKSSLT